MARQIRTYTGGQVNARNISYVPQGVHASAEAFGAGRARDLYNFGGAVRNVGDTVMDINEIKQRRVDDSTVRAEMTKLSDERRAYEKNIFETRKGRDAKDVEEEGRRWYEERKADVLSRLDSRRPRQAQLFEAQFDSLRESSLAALNRHSFIEAGKAEYATREAQNEDFKEDTVARGLFNRDIVDGNRELIHANIRANNPGQSDEVIAALIRDADRDLYGRMADAYANLDDALRFIESDEVKRTFPVREWTSIHNKLKVARDKRLDEELDTEASLYAISRRNEEVPLSQLQEELIRKYGDERGSRAYQRAATQEAAAKAEQAETRRVQAEKHWDEFYETGKIPDGASRADRDAMTKRLAERAKGEPSGEPWAFGQYLMDTFTPEQLQQMQRDGKWGEIYAKLNPDGKKTDIYGDVYSYATGKDEGVKGAIPPERYARQKFIAITGVKPGSKTGAKEFNAFISHFNEEVERRAFELELKDVRALPREEQEKIVADLLEMGDWGFWGWDKRRYQVMGEDNYEASFRPHAPRATSAAPSASAPQSAADAEAAPQASPTTVAGRRDVATASAAGEEIVSNQGVVQRVQGNRLEVHYPVPAEPGASASARGNEDRAEPKPVHETVTKYVSEYGASKEWNGRAWVLILPNGRTLIIDANGNLAG